MSIKPRLVCSVCGDAAGRFQQWWNQDTGWGVCRSCADWLETKGYAEDEMQFLYGKPGIHYEAKGENHAVQD